MHWDFFFFLIYRRKKYPNLGWARGSFGRVPAPGTGAQALDPKGTRGCKPRPHKQTAFGLLDPKTPAGEAPLLGSPKRGSPEPAAGPGAGRGAGNGAEPGRAGPGPAVRCGGGAGSPRGRIVLRGHLVENEAATGVFILLSHPALQPFGGPWGPLPVDRKAGGGCFSSTFVSRLSSEAKKSRTCWEKK